MSAVVIVTPDVVGSRMAGPGIRALHFAEELAKAHPTTLIARVESDGIDTDRFRLIDRRSAEAAAAIRDAAVLIGQPARGFHRLRREQRIIYDLFDPTVLELRELYGNAPSIRQRIHLAAEWSRLSYALMFADALICAAPRQRDFYQQLQAGNAEWIEVPFGVEIADVPPRSEPPGNLVIWGGGIWEWLDPATAVDAVNQVNAQGTACTLLFLGRLRPNRDLIDRRRDDRFESLLARGGEHVKANADWIPYRDRLSWLRTAKVAIMLHRATQEAEYAIRTRLFDAIAASVPVVATERGFAAELVKREGIGLVVPPEDPARVADAIRRLLTDDAFHASCVENLERLRPRFAWDVVTRPLIEKVNAWLK